MSFSILTFSLLVGSFPQEPPKAQPSTPISKLAALSQNEESTRVVPISEEVLVIEAPTLIANSLLAGRTQMQSKDYVDPHGKEQSAGFSNDSALDNAEQVTAMRLYGLTLCPGEGITLNMKGESASKLAMRLVLPSVPNGMTPHLKRVNRMPRPLRSSRITLKNILDEPFKMVLMVYGEAGYKYRIEIKRAN